MFTRSAIRLAKNVTRADVDLHMAKWWKVGYNAQNGVVTKSLSPFEQKVVEPLFEGAGEKVGRYLKRWSYTVFPSFGFFYGAMIWADHDFERRHMEHWD